uniref:6-bladed beta-propeller n=1 Tax=Salmonella sp. s54836 TaxID=3159673 RepID=UPI00397FA353
IFRGPRDINLTNDLIIVLDINNPCMHLFNITDYSLLSSIISKGTGGQIEDSSFFTVDRELNLILTDSRKHCVTVFSKSGEVIAQFGKEGHSVGEFTEPMGVAIDNEKRIVVVSWNKNNALQIF